MKRNFIFLALFYPLFAYSALATYYSYDDPRLPEHKSFWSYFSKTPLDVSLMPKSMEKYLRDKQLRSGNYVLVKPRFENEIVIFSDGPYYSTVWRSGTAIHNETTVLNALFKNNDFLDLFNKLNFMFYRLAIYNPLNTPGGSTTFYVYQMPGFQLKTTAANCQQWMQIVQQTGYTGDAFSCSNEYFIYSPAYSYKDIKHFGTWIQ